jgi:hypothetical protein
VGLGVANITVADGTGTVCVAKSSVSSGVVISEDLVGGKKVAVGDWNTSIAV